MIEGRSAPIFRFPFRAAIRVALGIGLLAFVLPFASVSCGGHEVFTARGVNAAIGGQYTVSGHVNYYSGDPYFLVAVLGAVLALASQLMHRYARVSMVASAVAGLGCVVGMLVGQAHVNSQIAGLGSHGVITIRWQVGYWIALFAIGAGTVLAAFTSYRAVRVRSVPASASAIITAPASRATIAGGVIAMVAALVIIAACAIPYVHYTTGTPGPVSDPTYSPSVFAPGFGASNWFAAEPVAVAILAFVAGVALVEWTSPLARAFATGVLLAFGVQTFLLFIGYFALATGSPGAQLGPGGIVGAFGGLLLFAAGLAALNLSRRTPVRATMSLVRNWRRGDRSAEDRRQVPTLSGGPGTEAQKAAETNRNETTS